ncbi:hypothetical protein ABK040_012498 [Willaertia magna]
MTLSLKIGFLFFLLLFLIGTTSLSQQQQPIHIQETSSSSSSSSEQPTVIPQQVIPPTQQPSTTIFIRSLPNINFQLDPFIQHLNSLNEYEEQLKIFKNILLILYFPWDSTVEYELKDNLRKFIYNNNNLLQKNGTMISEEDKFGVITLNSLQNSLQKNFKFVIRAVNYHNLKDKEFIKKFPMINSPIVKFIVTDENFNNFENNYFYNNFNKLQLFIENSVFKKVENNFNFCNFNFENILNNKNGNEYLLIGYFPKNKNLSNLENEFDKSFFYFSNLKINLLKFNETENIYQTFNCLTNLVESILENNIVLYHLITKNITIFNKVKDKYLVDYILNKYEPLVGELLHLNHYKKLMNLQKEKIILFLKNKKDENLIKEFKKLSLYVKEQYSNETKFVMIEDEFSNFIYNKHVYRNIHNENSIVIFSKDNRDIYLLDKCTNNEIDKLIPCFDQFISNFSQFEYHNSLETKNSISYYQLQNILQNPNRQNTKLLLIYDSTMGNTYYLFNLLKQLNNIDIIKLDIKYNDIPVELNQKQSMPSILLIMPNSQLPIIYNNTVISLKLLKEWIHSHSIQQIDVTSTLESSPYVY